MRIFFKVILQLKFKTMATSFQTTQRGFDQQNHSQMCMIFLFTMAICPFIKVVPIGISIFVQITKIILELIQDKEYNSKR